MIALGTPVCCSGMLMPITAALNTKDLASRPVKGKP
jgi:hypothetical protein